MSNNECENAGGLAPKRAQNKMNHLPPLSIIIMSQTSAEFIEVFLEMRHEADTEGVAGVQPLLLHQEVHRLGETLVVTHSEALHAARLQ